MPKYTRIGLLAVIFGISAAVSPVSAQDEIPVKVNNQNRSGELPFSGVIGTDAEHVDIAGWNLLVSIPIFSGPGRGMDYGFSLRYGARFLVMATRRDPVTGVY